MPHYGSRDSATPTLWPAWPQFGDAEIDAVTRVVHSQQLFAGENVREFESEFSSFIGSAHSIAVGNATQGLHLALAALDVGIGDEVIVTPCSWISSASCVLMQNAVPVFVDIEPRSLGLDPDCVLEAITERTKAIVLVHVLGYPAQVREICAIGLEYGIPVVEDASHAPGAATDGKKLGSWGSVGVFSFQQRKAISTGDGAMLTTNDGVIAERLWQLRSFGSEELSYNYRMSEFAAALGRLGLKRLETDNSERRRAAFYLERAFSEMGWIEVRHPRKNEVGAYYAIRLDVDLSDSESERFVHALARQGFPIRKVFSPLNKHPHFNPSKVPARGLPWLDPRYAVAPPRVTYADLYLPTAYEYTQGRVVELYAHPTITDEQLDNFVTRAQAAHKLVKGW